MNKFIDRPAEESLRPIIQSLAGSQIREVVNASLDQTDILKFWFGNCQTSETPRVLQSFGLQL